MKLETIASSFTPKGMKYDGMPFHRSAGGITRPEVGASLAFVDRIASLGFQIRHLDDHSYIPKLKALLMKEFLKKFPSTEKAGRYIDLAIHENCLNDKCEKCGGVGYTASKFKLSQSKKLTDETKRWWKLEVDYDKGITDIHELSKRHGLLLEPVRWYVIKKKYDALLKAKLESSGNFFTISRHDTKVCLLADEYGVKTSDIYKKSQEWKQDEQRKQEEAARLATSRLRAKNYARSRSKKCTKCNGSGYGVMLEKERAEFIGVAAKAYSSKHKQRYNYIYILLRDQLDKINVN